MLWRGQTVTELPALGGDYGNATSINASGDAVGASSTAGNQATHATLWTNGRAIDLGTLGAGLLSVAGDINDHGDIVGYSTISDDFSTYRAVLWKNHTAYDLGRFGGVGQQHRCGHQ
jgi:probable HAF family extracellular repeat protein